MAAADDGGRDEFLPPTALESSVRALGADTVRYRIDYVMLPMRDGVRLATVVIRPRAAGRYPTLMVRTPYQVASFPESFRPMHTAQFASDYVLIVQNERGSEWSEGSKGLFYRGGVPVIQIAALWFGSYGIHQRPKLPAAAQGDELSRIFRRYSVSVPNFRDPEYARALAKSTREAPSGEVLRRMGAPSTGYETYLAEGPAGPAWREVDLIDARHTGATPSLNINGWMDIGTYETVKLFEFQQHHPEQYLIMAPTGHCTMLWTEPDAFLGDRPMGGTRFPYDEIVTSWFDRFLRDEPGEWQPMPKVQVFLMGAAMWLTGESWPLPETEERTLFLASVTSANTLWGDGTLAAAAGSARKDEFIADPANPVPSLGGGLATDSPVCVDQRDAECRADVLVYSTPVLDEPVSIAGDVRAELYVSADVADADVFLKLVDVYPDGTAYNLAGTCLRLRYRDGFDKPAELVPGQIYRVEVTGITTANYFPPGHRIRIEIAGSNFPVADRNWHAGERNDLASDGPIAHITLHHGAGRASALHFRAYTGEVVTGRPMASLRGASRGREEGG